MRLGAQGLKCGCVNPPQILMLCFFRRWEEAFQSVNTTEKLVPDNQPRILVPHLSQIAVVRSRDASLFFLLIAATLKPKALETKPYVPCTRDHAQTSRSYEILVVLMSMVFWPCLDILQQGSRRKDLTKSSCLAWKGAAKLDITRQRVLPRSTSNNKQAHKLSHGDARPTDVPSTLWYLGRYTQTPTEPAVTHGHDLRGNA